MDTLNVAQFKNTPNADLIKALEQILAKARLGQIIDGVFVGAGYQSSGRQDWFHHFSIERDDDVVAFVGELDLFKDILKANVHNTRNRAVAAAHTTSLSGLL